MNVDYLKKEIMFCLIKNQYKFYCGNKNDIKQFMSLTEIFVKIRDIFVNKVLEVENKNIQEVENIKKEELIIQHFKSFFDQYLFSNFYKDGEVRVGGIETQAVNSICFAENFLDTFSRTIHNGSYVIDNI